MTRQAINIVGIIVSALLGVGVAELCVDPISSGWFSEYELFCHFLLPPIVGAIAGALTWKCLWTYGMKRGWKFSLAEILGLLTLVGFGLAILRT